MSGGPAKDEGQGERLGTREIYRGRTFNADIDTVRLPNGETVDLELVHHRGAAAVVPVLDDGTVLLVKQYRYATGGWLLEIPAGKLDNGESPETCAGREAEEEVGYRPTKLEPLGWIWSSPGFCDEKIWLYLATGLQEAQQELEHDEILHIVRIPLDEAVEQAVRGEIHDAKSAVALVRAARIYKNPHP